MKVIEKKRAFNITRAYNFMRNLTLRIPHASIMKVFEKKNSYSITRNLSRKIPHTNTINSKITSIICNRVIWYSASLLLYFWFIYWIAYDIFVWHKPIAQGSVTNYVGAVLAMAMVWAGTKLPIIIKYTARFFPQKRENQKPQDENKKDTEPKKRKHTPKTTTQPKPTTQTQTQTPLPQPPHHHQPTLIQPGTLQPESQPQQPTQLTPNIPGCKHHFGYLHEPGKIKNMPDECLICKQLTKCLTQIKE